MSEGEVEMEQVDMSLNACCEVLGELGSGCCVDGRRSTIKGLEAEIRAQLNYRPRSADESQFEREHELLAEWGATLGRLSVTCCTDQRAPLYFDALAHLRAAFEQLMRTTDAGH